MTDRLYRVFAAVQERYLHDPALRDIKAIAAHVDWLREVKQRTVEGLRASAADPDWLDERADDLVIEREIIGKLPPRLVHERWNSWAYLEAEATEPIDPATVRHDELSTLHWYDRAAKATVDSPEPVGDPADYRGFDPIEDVASAPKMNWTDADRKVALEKAIGTYGVEPGQWFELEWPPRAQLYDPGYVCTTEFVPCDAHVECDGDEECVACSVSVQQVVESMAQWKWTTTLRINEIRFDRDGTESSTAVYNDQTFEVAITEQDPREILIGPPGRDQLW